MKTRANALPITIRLTGPVTLRDGAGAAIRGLSRRAQAMLAHLSQQPGQRAERGRLADLVWSDRSDVQARASLRQELSVLRGTDAPRCAARKSSAPIPTFRPTAPPTIWCWPRCRSSGPTGATPARRRARLQGRGAGPAVFLHVVGRSRGGPHRGAGACGRGRMGPRRSGCLARPGLRRHARQSGPDMAYRMILCDLVPAGREEEAREAAQELLRHYPHATVA